MRALIADDEAPARNRLKRLLAENGVTVVGEAANGPQALELAESLRPDVLLLDIEMPELSGLEVAEALGETQSETAIVFVTAYDAYAARAFDVCAVDYVVKPVHPPRLTAALERAQRNSSRDWLARLRRELPTTPRRQAVKCGSRYLVFDPARVSALIARDHYTAILTEGRELLADEPLEAVAKKFASEGFLRIHRSAAIQLSFLKELEREGDRKYVAVLDDPARTRVPVSRDRLPQLKQSLGLVDLD